MGLKDSGLKVAIFDKATFPRDKVCGDAIPARAVRVLREVAPEAAKVLQGLEWKTDTRSCKVISPSDDVFTYHFSVQGHCAKRLDFDAFLFTQMKAHAHVDCFEGKAITGLNRNEHGWELETADQQFQARLVIGCDGANGLTTKATTDFQMDPQHHCAAVRAYYKNVGGLSPDTMEIYLLKDWLPGYFWIFPVSETECNVGYGMLSAQVAKRKVALRQSIPSIVESHPALRQRFKEAKLQGPIQGFGLPLGSRMIQMSGANFLLTGDAASLIDPATGEGIGNAMWSGQIAARWAIKAFQQHELSEEFLAGYGLEIRKKMERELRYKYWVQQLLGERQWLVNWAVRSANRRGLVAWLVKKVF